MNANMTTEMNPRLGIKSCALQEVLSVNHRLSKGFSATVHDKRLMGSVRYVPVLILYWGHKSGNSHGQRIVYIF